MSEQSINTLEIFVSALILFIAALVVVFGFSEIGAVSRCLSPCFRDR